MFTPWPDAVWSQEPFDCKSDTLPTELCGPLSIILIMRTNVYKLNDVSNNVIQVIYHLKQCEL